MPGPFLLKIRVAQPGMSDSGNNILINYNGEEVAYAVMAANMWDNYNQVRTLKATWTPEVNVHFAGFVHSDGKI